MHRYRTWILCSLWLVSLTGSEHDYALTILSSRRIQERSEQLQKEYMRTYRTRTALQVIASLNMLNIVVNGTLGTFAIQHKIASCIERLRYVDIPSELFKAGLWYNTAALGVAFVGGYMKESFVRSFAYLLTAIIKKPLEGILRTEYTMCVQESWFLMKQINDPAVDSVVMSKELYHFVHVLKALDFLTENISEECIIEAYMHTRMIELVEELVAYMQFHTTLEKAYALQIYMPVMIESLDHAAQKWSLVVSTSPDAESVRASTHELQQSIYRAVRMLTTIPFYQIDAMPHRAGGGEKQFLLQNCIEHHSLA